MLFIWLKFIACACLIFFAGKRVARYADVISEKTGLSGLWIGLILVAVATSLPELFTGIGSVVFVDAPDLTVGNIFGANSYNLLNIALLDTLYKGTPLLSVLSSGQLLAAVFSLIPLMLAAIAIILHDNGFSFWSAGNVGIFSIAIFVSYCILSKVLYNFEKKRPITPSSEKSLELKVYKYSEISVKKAYLYYAASAGVIVLSGIWLAYIGKELSHVLGLNTSFVGNLFIGFATTLPEITVSIAALAIGAKEIAVANMLGSNLFNTTIIFVDDILYRKAPILQVTSPNHVWSASIVMAMTAIIIIAMATKPRNKLLNISWYTPVLIIIFLLGAYINFRMGLK